MKCSCRPHYYRRHNSPKFLKKSPPIPEEGNLLLWQQDESSLDKIITEFPDNTDYQHSLHLEQGDTLWMDDKDFYHALTPITQGVRVTAISRWGNQTPDRGFDY